MNRIFVNKYLQYRVQDSKKAVLLLFFFVLPLTALLPHTHLFAALWVLAPFILGVWERGRRHLLYHDTRAKIFTPFLALSLSGAVLPLARGASLLSSVLRLSFFLPLLFPERKGEMRRSLAIIGGFFGVLAVLEVLLGMGKSGYSDPSLFPSLPRAAGVFGNPNLLAAFLLPTASFALEDALFIKEGRTLSWLCFLGSALGVTASYSRGALLALLLTSFWLFTSRFGFPRVVVTLFAFTPLLLLLLPSSLLARLSSVLSPDTSVLYRFSLWKSVFRLSLRTLFLGVGEGRPAMLSALSPVLASGLIHVEHTHSLFLHVLFAEGVLGLFLLLALCLHVLFFSKSRGAKAALLSLLFFGIFDDPLYSGQTEVILWLSLGLG